MIKNWVFSITESPSYRVSHCLRKKLKLNCSKTMHDTNFILLGIIKRNIWKLVHEVFKLGITSLQQVIDLFC